MLFRGAQSKTHPVRRLFFVKVQNILTEATVDVGMRAETTPNTETEYVNGLHHGDKNILICNWQ